MGFADIFSLCVALFFILLMESLLCKNRTEVFTQFSVKNKQEIASEVWRLVKHYCSPARLMPFFVVAVSSYENIPCHLSGIALIWLHLLPQTVGPSLL